MMMFGLVFVFCCTSFAVGDQTEPTCYSRFDYDEKMLMKLLKIEDQIQKFGEIISEMKSAHEAESLERMRLFNTELEALKVVTAEAAKKQKDVNAEIRQAIDIVDDKFNGSLQKQQVVAMQVMELLNDFKSFQGVAVAFTVTNPAPISRTGVLTFSEVVMNEGNSFDIATGEFKCPVSGLYYFTLHIVKMRRFSVNYAGCNIQMNGSNIVRAHTDPQNGPTGADGGSYGASNSAYVRLAVNDSVTLGGCSGAESMENWSSFSGYLAQQDL